MAHRELNGPPTTDTLGESASALLLLRSKMATVLTPF
jgi:hypothetical protein